LKILKDIEKIREYCDYLEEHIINVRKAWLEIQEKCNDMFFIQDDNYYENIGQSVLKHDMSKVSEYEFIQYQKAFYPSVNEIDKYSMNEAWQHHIINNPHHWENWTKNYAPNVFKTHWVVHCVHMIVDWMAMGYKFGDTAQAYYEKNKDKIELPDEAIKLMYEIFKKIR